MWMPTLSSRRTTFERIKQPFADPKVAVAAGIVQVWNPRGVIQRGREIEYLVVQHLYRPLQNMWSSPTVCPGCACAFRREPLAAAGGFPDGTIAEDMDYTWRAMLAGYKAVYVGGAECYVNDPRTPRQLKTQLWRWMSGYFQCARLHWKEILHHKKVLVLLVSATVWDILSLPIMLAAPFVLAEVDRAPLVKLLVVAWLSSEILITMPLAMIGAMRRGLNPLWALVNWPFLWFNRAFACYYSTKAMITELILVPLGWSKSMAEFHKGH